MINKERLLNTFLDYIRIDSETLNEKAMCKRVADDLQALGLDATIDNAGEAFGSNGGNVYCYIDGDSSYEPVILSAHLDTVVPGKSIEPYIDGEYIRSKGHTILGGDDKSGVAAIIEAVRYIKENNLRHRPIEIVFSISEEGGLKGAKHLDHSKLISKHALVLDSGGSVGTIITAAPGQNKISATITGIPSHAGAAPEKGVSAIMVMSDAIANMKLLRIDEETTANIGTVTAQGPTNIVSEKSYMLAEARSRNQAKLDAQTNHMIDTLKASCEKFGATLEYNVEEMYQSYNLSEDDEFIKLLEEKFTGLGFTVSKKLSGGGSDANVYSKHSIKSVAIGTGMDKVHTTDEQIKVSDLYDTAKFLVGFLTV